MAPKLLNLGCGEKTHPAWINIDINPSAPGVIACDLTRGIPYPDNEFDAVYHSQVLEHIPRAEAPGFLKECHRVLKPGGILRVVTPDLENLAREYLRCLERARSDGGALAEADYDWITIELLDQLVREHSGGLMFEYFCRPEIPNWPYLLRRIGRSAEIIRRLALERMRPPSTTPQKISLLDRLRGVKHSAKRLLHRLAHPCEDTPDARLGRFRRSGEIHHWLYDGHSLTRLLRQAGFARVELKTPYESGIEAWAGYELDVKDGQPYDPTSLFVEAVK